MGIMVRDLGMGGADPIQHDPDKCWPALFQLEKLLKFLFFLYSNAKNWHWLHHGNVGWIHAAQFSVLSNDDEV